MSTGAIIGIVIVVIVVVAAVVVASREMRRARLRRQFGPEYDRLAQQLGNRSKADAELAADSGASRRSEFTSFRRSSRPATAATGPRSRSGSLTPQSKRSLPRAR